ncbi:MAG: DNA repair protein RecN [Candidatus Cloacimonas sp.]|jgi:DNA repair protein RecN (Recombination protein N)|nr:DNA repair protein RecN [Candidatus Cloacimonas sp.]
MLSEIYIKNYLMLPEIRLPFISGLTVLSGETGAGKSILIGSISLIFADNSPGMEAYDKTLPIYLEATFQPSNDDHLLLLLANSGISKDEELILAREISPSGKSSYFINGRKVAASIMKELKPLMIDFHHQRDQQRLLSTTYQLELLDAFADTGDLRSEFSILYHQTKQNIALLKDMTAEAEHQKQLQELYQFQYDELLKAKLNPDEDETLQQEYELLSHAREIRETSLQIKQNLFEQENCIYDQVSNALGKLSRYENLNKHITEATQNMRQALESLQESAVQLDDVEESISSDPDRITLIQNRLDEINTLVFKHRVRSIRELICLFGEREKQIASFSNREEAILAMETKLQDDFLCLKNKADELSALRTVSSGLLRAELECSIRDLSIPQGIFEIRIDKKAKPEFLLSQFISAVSETGQDAVDFLFCANPGFELKPLVAVASGGELSRILLAIKKVLAKRISHKLIILDEIDSGIGGKTAERVAEFIYSLGREQQVLCITHLAQIAAIAETHIAIEKVTDSTHSIVTLRKLNAGQRLQEIARMLSGKVSDLALKHAEELIKDIKQRG